MTDDWATAQHEARHICAIWFVDAAPESAAVGIHAPPEVEGIVRMGPMENGCANLLTRVVGWLTDANLPKKAMWPPPYPPPIEHDVDGLSWCVRHYGLSEEAYLAVCQIARDLVEDPDFKRAVNLVARGLSSAPLIDKDGLEVLRQATAFADEPEPEGALTT